MAAHDLRVTFRGELSFASHAEIDAAFTVAKDEAAGESLVDCAAFTRLEEPKLRLDFECSAPASMWEPTLALLDTLASHAVRGRLMCVYEGDGEEDEIETLPGGEYDERGPFPVAFIGALSFADVALQEALAEHRDLARHLATKLQLVVEPRSVKVEQRLALFRRVGHGQGDREGHQGCAIEHVGAEHRRRQDMGRLAFDDAGKHDRPQPHLGVDGHVSPTRAPEDGPG